MTIETVSHDLDFSPIHERMQWYVDQEIIPCCNTLVMRGTDVLDVRTYGGLDRESGRSLERESIFRMHSSTKLATSVAAMMLFEEGRFDLADPLEKYIPEFATPRVLVSGATSIDQTEPARDSMRVHQVLSHSAGLSYGFVEPESLIDQSYAAAGLSPLANPDLSLETLCRGLAQQPLAYPPGTDWRYSFATDVTARLVELLSGRRFDVFLRERIFEPLGMVDTDFWVPPAKRDRLVAMYLPHDLLQPMKSGLTRMPDDQGEAPPKFLSGGGGLYSTLVDYLEFTRMLANGGEWRGHRFLKAETLERMRKNQLADGIGVHFPMWALPSTVFGLGFALKEAPAEGEPAKAAGEFHWGGMAGTHIWVNPGANLAGICMTQRMPGFWHPFSHDFKRLAYSIA